MSWSSASGWVGKGWSRSAAVVDQTPFALASGAPASSTSPRVTTTAVAPVGSVVVCSCLVSGTPIAGSPVFQDTRGNTWVEETAVQAGALAFRLRTYRCVVTTQIEIGDSLGPNFTTSVGPYIAACCSAGLGAGDLLTHAGFNGSVTTAVATTIPALSAQPEYLFMGYLSDHYTNTVAPAGWTAVVSMVTGAPGNSSFGVRIFAKRVTTTASDTTFAQTLAGNASWAAQYLTYNSL